jgi:hypothetical protein
VGRSEKVFFLLLPLATKHWNLPLTTKHWNLPLATELGSSFTSFLFLLFKEQIWIIWGFLFWSREIMINLVDGRKKESRLDGCSSFEKMEVNRDSVGNLKS